MKVKSIWNRLYSIGQDYNMMTSFRTFKFFHSCLNVFGFQGLICCFNQNVPGTSLNEFNEHHMRCHGYLHIIAHWRLSFLWALGRACEEANCRLNPVFSTTQKVSLLNVLKMNKRTIASILSISQYCKEDRINFQKYLFWIFCRTT